MKRIILSIIALFSVMVNAQNVGIGTNTPKELSKLDVESSTTGFLLPRMTTVQRATLGANVSALGAALSAQYNGMMVYDTDNNTMYMWDSNKTDFTNGGWNNVLDADASIADNDADPNNEIQDLSLSGNTLSLSGDATTVNLTPYVNTDNQDLSLSGNTLSLTNDASAVNLAPYLDNTDDQKVDVFSLSGNTLNLSLESDGEATKTVDLAPLKDHDWYESTGTNQADNINDNIYTNGNVGIGTNNPQAKLYVEGGRVEFTGTADATGAAGSGVLEIANALRIDENEIITNTDQILYLQNDNNGDLRVDETTLVVDASENFVGIGTITPNSKLHVEGDIYTNNNVLAVHSTATDLPTSPNLDHIWHDDTDNAWHLVSDGTYKADGNTELYVNEVHMPGNVAYVVDRAYRTLNNSNVGYRTVGNATSSLAVKTGDVVVINVTFKFWWTGGSGGDHPYFGIQINGTCGTISDNDTRKHGTADDNPRGQEQSMSYQYVWVATCNGNVTFNLNCDNNSDADDTAGFDDICIVATKY